MPITVVNKYSYYPDINDVQFYIGRGSALGNPYTSKSLKNTKALYQCTSPEESIAMYREYLQSEINKDDRQILDQLRPILISTIRGYNVKLICYCAPKPCHGDVVKEFIENAHKEYLAMVNLEKVCIVYND